MRILQINTVSGTGSVGRIAVDLYRACEKAGHAPYIAYGRGKAAEQTAAYKIGSRLDFYQHVLRNFFQGESGFGSGKKTEAFLEWVDQIGPDLIHLHNIHGFYLNVEMLFEFLKKKNIPVVWTLHDSWSFTGHCAYFDYAGCDKWKTGCESCPIHRTAYPYAIFKDNSQNAYIRKQQCFQGVRNLVIVTPSKWLGDLVKESFLKEYPVKVIPNGIDLEKFRPMKEIEKKKVILGVANVWEARKGLPYFEKLAEHLREGYRIKLVGVNKSQEKRLLKKFPKGEIVPVARTESIEELAALYNEASVYVNPTLEDNFPTTNLEALACGTPVVTFETGGSPESLNPSCGKVVKKGNFHRLLAAVEEILSIVEEQKLHPDSAGYLYSVKACRARAHTFQKEERYGEYLKLYEQMKK